MIVYYIKGVSHVAVKNKDIASVGQQLPLKTKMKSEFQEFIASSVFVWTLEQCIHPTSAEKWKCSYAFSSYSCRE